MEFHASETKKVLEEIKSNPDGLSSDDAKKRIEQYGLNELKEGEKISPVKIFLNQFRSIVVWILIAATIISMFLKEYVDSIVILVVLLLIGVLGFIQEYKAERAIEALKRLASLKAVVLRDGKKVEIDSKDIVPGDILILETGNKIPADARLIEVMNFQTLEAALTGESTPVKKNTNVYAEKTILADRKNMVFSSTIVTAGRAKAVVIGTGMNTEIGKIADMIQKAKPEPTPLQKKMDELGKVIGYITIVISIIVFVVGLFLHKGTWMKMLITSVSLAVAAIPEGLPAVVTITLAIGTQRMLKRHALIRKLPSVETLGSTTVICTDKTGTLTMNEMTVKNVYVNGKVIDVSGSGYEIQGDFLHNSKSIDDEELMLLLKIGAQNNNAEHKEGKIIGDPTEGALIVSAAKKGHHKTELDTLLKRIDEIEFTSERKMMTTIHDNKGKRIVYSKGAPDVLLEKCSFIHENGKVRKITFDDKKKILDVNRKFAEKALRVLGFAYKNELGNDAEKEMIFVGLQAMIDPPRAEVKEAIQKCNNAGIRVIMITGDHEITAKAVANEIGILGNSMSGTKLDEVSDEELDKILDGTSIFARVNPEHKIKIVDVLKKKGHIVAMTGDGVNDAPALKKADIGIAMGITGTDVAKEASSMILTDDNFASIVNAVEEGRGVFDNIRKYFAFLISGNIAEVLIIFFAILMGLPVPLTATQLLTINLITDGLPAIALSADPFEPNAMKRKPRKQKEPIYKGLNEFIIYYPILMTVVGIAIFSYAYAGNPENLPKAQTMTWLVIVFFELYQAFACRSTRYPSVKVGLFKNKWLILAVLSSVAMAVVSVYVPSLHNIFDTASITIPEFIGIVLISSLGGLMIEIVKWHNMKKEVPLETGNTALSIVK